MLLFIFLEVGVFLLPLYWWIKREEKVQGMKWIYIATAATLLALPFYRFGIFNDLNLRGSVPALFALAMLVIRAINNSRSFILKGVLILLLAIGSVTPLLETAIHLRGYGHYQNVWVTIANPIPDNIQYKSQYYGNKDSVFFKYLARKK